MLTISFYQFINEPVQQQINVNIHQISIHLVHKHGVRKFLDWKSNITVNQQRLKTDSVGLLCSPLMKIVKELIIILSITEGLAMKFV